MKVIVDSDGAFDDHKAILYLLERDDVEVLALSMSGTGIAHCPYAADNMAAILEMIDAPDIPVACGTNTPMVGTNEAPPNWRYAADNLGGMELPEPRSLSPLPAPELIVDVVGEADDDVVLVALGPMTNVAQAHELDPDLFDGVERIVWMGGAVDVGGNVSENVDAEFNVWADPGAAAAVFGADVPITLVPLDATNAVPVTPYLYEVVALHSDHSAVAGFMHEYLEAQPFFGGMYHWDELAAVVTTEHDVGTYEDRRLAVVEDGGEAAGATIETPDGRLVSVAVDAGADAFESHFYEAIIGTADTGVAPFEADAVMTFDGDDCSWDGPDPLVPEFTVRLDNNSDEHVVMFTGVYAPGTTAADVEAWRETGGADIPTWWTMGGVYASAGGAQDVWLVRADPDGTAICMVDPERTFEIAGPKVGF